MLRRSISWDVRPPKVIDHHDSRLHHRHDRTQLNRGGSSRHLSTDPSFKKNDMMMMVTKENISDGGGDHSSSNSQNDHASMDCEDDGDDDNDNCGGNQDEESSSRQNKAWYTVSFLSWFLVLYEMLVLFVLACGCECECECECECVGWWIIMLCLGLARLGWVGLSWGRLKFLLTSTRSFIVNVASNITFSQGTLLSFFRPI